MSAWVQRCQRQSSIRKLLPQKLLTAGTSSAKCAISASFANTINLLQHRSHENYTYVLGKQHSKTIALSVTATH